MEHVQRSGLKTAISWLLGYDTYLFRMLFEMRKESDWEREDSNALSPFTPSNMFELYLMAAPSANPTTEEQLTGQPQM